MQEEEFAAFYCTYHNQTKAAYYSGLCKNIKLNKSYDKLTPKEIRSLSNAGNKMLKKDHVLERIEELKNIARVKLETDYINCQKAIYEFYANVMRRSLAETERISVREGIEAAKELMKKFEDKSNNVTINIVDPMKGRQKKC